MVIGFLGPISGKNEERWVVPPRDSEPAPGSGKAGEDALLYFINYGVVKAPGVFGDDKPMRRNSPSSPELFLADPTQGDFERERAQLMQAIDRFATAGAVGCTQHPHPFFGPLQPQQWAILMYKHVDHHLRQFGV
jgi:hypothetical protein